MTKAITERQRTQGTAAERAGFLTAAMVGGEYLEEDTGLLYFKTQAGAWQLYELLAAGDALIGRVKISDGTDVALVDANGNLSGTRTIKTVTGTISATTDVVAAVTSKRIKVFYYKLFTASTTSVTVTAQSNASTALDTTPLQAPAANSLFGANVTVSPPDFLFATVAGQKLTLNLSGSISVIYTLSYWDDDAT